jgi:hypothetical protein
MLTCLLEFNKVQYHRIYTGNWAVSWGGKESQVFKVATSAVSGMFELGTSLPGTRLKITSVLTRVHVSICTQGSNVN